MRVRKEVIEIFNCDACGKTFTKKAYLNQHKRIHAVRRKYDCKLCDKVYNSDQFLEKHIQKDHPTPSRVENANVGFLVLDTPMPPKKVSREIVQVQPV